MKGGAQLGVGSRRRDYGSLQVKGGGTASNREQEEGLWVTAGEGRGTVSSMEQEAVRGRSFKYGAGGMSTGHSG